MNIPLLDRAVGRLSSFLPGAVLVQIYRNGYDQVIHAKSSDWRMPVTIAH
jgi:hypothetical protein